MLLLPALLSALLPGASAATSGWSPPHYNQSVIDAFNAKAHIDPFPVPEKDPYREHINTNRTGVCGIQYQDERKRQAYKVRTFNSIEELENTKTKVHLTHTGPCGLCSTLQDLAAYMSHNDMTNPVRKCGFKGFVSERWAMKCLQDLGLTKPCAKIWFFNTRNTRKECFFTCIKNLNKPYNKPDGSLNDCLQCDEDKSGPVFKKVAARTRRDSGLESAIHRSPETISHVTHYYY